MSRPLPVLSQAGKFSIQPIRVPWPDREVSGPVTVLVEATLVWLDREGSPHTETTTETTLTVG